MTTPNGTGITNRGTNYADGSQVTSGNLKEHVDNAVFNNNAVDGVTLGLNASSPKALFVNNQGIDTAQLKDDAVTEDKLSDSALTFIKSALYPVGYILTTVNDYADSAAVVTAFGGTTWVRFGAGKVPVGYDSGDTDFDTAEETGGVKEVTLTAAQSGLPAHSHTLLGGGFNQSTGAEPGSNRDSNLGQTGTTGGTDASSAHTNLQPYIVVYMWKRTA